MDALPTFPIVAYHPVFGKRVANDASEMAVFEGDKSDWFDSAAEADAHRTQREAEIVIAHRLANRVDHALKGDHPVSGEIVENSVTADQHLRDGDKVEP